MTTLFSGRHLMTAQNKTEALEYMKTYGATHLLFVADEIGKYGAYSSIGSDENYDRFSTIGTFGLDPKQRQETRNETLLIYTGGVTLDETFNYKGTGSMFINSSLIRNNPDLIKGIHR